MTEFEAFAVALSREAARVALPFFRGEYAQENKAGPGAFDPVTEADRAAEAAIRAMIADRYPDHGVIGEEYGEDRPDADHVWILDPIDGTRAFIAGLPLLRPSLPLTRTHRLSRPTPQSLTPWAIRRKPPAPDPRLDA